MRQDRNVIRALCAQKPKLQRTNSSECIREFIEGFDAKVYDDGYGDYAKDRGR